MITKSIKQKILSIACVVLIMLVGCDKQNEWLDIKSAKELVVPQTLGDFQAILGRSVPMNNRYTNTGLVGADNFYLTSIDYAALDQGQRNLYTWNKEIWAGGVSPDWEYMYYNIELANVVLEGLLKNDPNAPEFSNVKGQAYFFRALAFYNLAQLFCKPYEATTAGTDPGLPLRLSADVNIIYPRATVSATYERIIADLQEAIQLLPEAQPFIQRPNRYAAMALLAKTYLTIGSFDQAKVQAGNVLAKYGTLLDYNSTVVNPVSTYRFPALGVNNPEIIFYGQSAINSVVLAFASSQGIVADELYNSYLDNDLRKTIFFLKQGNVAKYKGGYTGNDFNFSGLACNEMYLVRAECLARQGNKDGAMADLNALLRKRFKTGTFTDLIVASAMDALSLILNERRKELPFTGNIRWEDLRRLNKEASFKRTLTRTLNGTTYTLLPNDPRYVLPIPQVEIELTDLTQNER